MTETAPKTSLDINDIFQILPHRYPFLLIDRVVEIVRKQRIVAIKNVTINEPFFAGHFPNLPIMPGVLIVEAIAQARSRLGALVFGGGDYQLDLGSLQRAVGAPSADYVVLSDAEGGSSRERHWNDLFPEPSESWT